MEKAYLALVILICMIGLTSCNKSYSNETSSSIVYDSYDTTIIENEYTNNQYEEYNTIESTYIESEETSIISTTQTSTYEETTNRLKFEDEDYSIPTNNLLQSILNPLAAPLDYENTIQTGGPIEAKYLAHGNKKVKRLTVDGSETTKKIYVFYPTELESKSQKYPVIIMLNGSGVYEAKYEAVFKHYASWGFIVVGSDDPSSGFGISADELVDFIIKENSLPNSIFYKKIDKSNIGIVGHSQGGAGVFTASSVMKHKDIYKTIVALSPTYEELSHNLGWNYDIGKVKQSVLMLAGTEGDFEMQLVAPIDKTNELFDKMTGLKVMARRTGAEHGEMLYSADGYVTAWFMWQLQDDSFASKAFVGKNPEILSNKLYQNQRSKV